jgi:hypothetical protein
MSIEPGFKIILITHFRRFFCVAWTKIEPKIWRPNCSAFVRHDINITAHASRKAVTISRDSQDRKLNDETHRLSCVTGSALSVCGTPVTHTAQYLQVAPGPIFVRIYIPRRNILVHRHTWRPTPVTYWVQTWRTSVESKRRSATTRDKPNWPNFDAYSWTKVEAFVMLAILGKPRKSMKNFIWHNRIQFMNLFVVYLTTLFSNLDYIASNERVISKWWIGKDVERRAIMA